MIRAIRQIIVYRIVSGRRHNIIKALVDLIFLMLKPITPSSYTHVVPQIHGTKQY